MNEYQPDEVSAPGETLQEILDDRGMTQTELATRLGLTHKSVNEIIKGRAPITAATSIALETVLGIPASFWNRFEAAYRESLARQQNALTSAEQLAWLDEIPWPNAVKLGWIRKAPTPIAQLNEVLRFFGVVSPTQYQATYASLAVHWRAHSDQNPHAVAFWLREGERAASHVESQFGMGNGDYDGKAFDKYLREARDLLRDEDPRSFVPSLQALCASVGVIVAFVEEFPGTNASGAARWLAPGRPLIQLSLRYRSHGHIWFSFFHEAAHILKHSKRATFIDSFLGEPRDQEEEEREANTFAENMLIPARDLERFIARGDFTWPAVAQFADDIRVHPGMVVGRLQHRGLVPRNTLNDLKQFYRTN